MENKAGIIRLEDLSTEQLSRIHAWKIVNNIAGQGEVITPELLEDYEGLIAPADKDGNNLILPANGGVWCLTNATFANGRNHIALSLCEAERV